MKTYSREELIDLLDKNSGDGDTPIRQAVNLLREQQKDADRLDWIWKEASKIRGNGVFRLRGIELFTVTTQHIFNTKGIRELLDCAMEIERLEKR